jgi:hypothetical protein
MSDTAPENDTPSEVEHDPTLDVPATDPDEAVPVDDSAPVDETSDAPTVEAQPEAEDTTAPTVPGDGGATPDDSGDAPVGASEPDGSFPVSGDAADTVTVPTPPGAATPTVQTVPAEDDADAAQFAASTGDNDTDPQSVPDEAQFGAGTGHRDHEVDESVTDNTPVPTEGDGGVSEWNDLKNMVAEVHAIVTDLQELVEAARPAIEKVTREVQEKGLMGLVAAMMSRGNG